MTYKAAFKIVSKKPKEITGNRPKEARGYKKGDTTKIYAVPQECAADLEVRTQNAFFIIVADIPDDVPIEKLKFKMTQGYALIEPDRVPGETKRELYRRCLWGVEVGMLPETKKNQLRDRRRTSITWGQLKLICFKKGVTNKFDDRDDYIDKNLEDGDVRDG